MFKYFILRKQQQLFCYFCGIVLAIVLMLLFPSVFRGSGFYLLLPSLSSAQLNWMMPHTRKNTVSGAIFCWKRF